ncbi:MAG: glycosyltransferase family 4 protein [Clostridia bacterium]|nr:glycosyltransferase family 4 protein [Clostridia bacterium]MBQ6721486.1 glycosyltransferase family 4 protein [Clostridia bacterium]
MNILYIEHYAGSPEMGMEFRPYYLAREWVKMGHHVRIVAGDYSHLRIRNPAVEKNFQTETTDGIDYVWIKTGQYTGNGAARALTMFRFVWKLWKNAKMIAENWKPDVIITSSTYPLDTYAGQRIKKKTKNHALLIHEVHDMWPITLIELGGMKKSNPFVQLIQMGENSFCRHSDYVVSLLCAAKDYFVEHGMKPEKFKVVMNGIVLDEWENAKPLPEEHKQKLDALHMQGKFVVCFFGSITKSYAIDYLLDAVEKLNGARAAVVIVGEGNQKEELMRRTAGREDSVFLPKISKGSIPSLLEEADCCYVGALHNDMFRFGICMNKLFDSMMSGKPILYAVDAPNNFITDYDCGISVKAEDADALADGLSKMLSLSPAERNRMGQNGRNAVLNHFTYEKLAKQFEEIFRR